MLCHDPRISNDRSHKVETDNLALQSAETMRRRNIPLEESEWEIIARLADDWDLLNWTEMSEQ